MKITQEQLRSIVEETLSEAPKKRKRDVVASKTYEVVRDYIVTSLMTATGTDENLSGVEYAVHDMEAFDDTFLDEESLVDDSKVKAAFLEFVRSQIGTFQMLGEDK